MSVRSAGLALAIASMALSSGSCAFQSPGSLNTTDSRSYQCEELKNVIAEQDKIYLSGFLGTRSVVFASPESCTSAFKRPTPSAWRTQDVFSCVVGYRCIDNASVGRGTF